MGNVTVITDSQQATGFTYDPLDRLTGAGGEYSASYTYDAIGNLLTKSEGGVGHTLAYTLTHPVHAPGAVDGQSYTYDANGNTVVRPGQVLTFGVENRLTQVLSGTQLTTFGYDGDGKRTIQTTVSGTTLFVGPLYEVFVPVSATMPTITSTVYPTQTYTARLPLVMGGWNGVDGALGQATKYYFADGRRIAMRDGNAGEPTYLYQDHLGSTMASSDGEGITYYPYGSTRSGAVSTGYQFTGQRNDGGTGLYYYGARYYDPVAGRFISADPAPPAPAEPQSRGRYAYGRNNPLRFTDPSGLTECETYNEDCLSNEWPWKNRWYQAHGYYLGPGGAWTVAGEPFFADDGIMDEVIAEGGLTLTDAVGPWMRADKQKLASGVAAFGQQLAQGVAGLAWLSGGSTAFLGPSPLPCNLGRASCAPPWGGHVVYLQTGFGPQDAVHEMAHVGDWSGPGGFQYFSSHWPYPALTQYATDYYGPLWPFYYWDSWAEAVTVFVFSDYRQDDEVRRHIDPNYVRAQMGTVRAMLEGWY